MPDPEIITIEVPQDIEVLTVEVPQDIEVLTVEVLGEQGPRGPNIFASATEPVGAVKGDFWLVLPS